jgi:hypothetical protein
MDRTFTGNSLSLPENKLTRMHAYFYTYPPSIVVNGGSLLPLARFIIYSCAEICVMTEAF